MGIEALLAPEDLRRDLILLRGGPWVFQGMRRQITEQLAKGFGTVQGMAAEKFFDLLEE